MKIAVGGMIASGKSSLVEKLGEHLGHKVMDEFEEDDVVFNTLLKWLYEGKSNVEMLLQVYFLHNHYLRQQEYGGTFIVDRDLIEHWLFAQENLKGMPEIMNMYNGVFHAYMNAITLPDLYIILDMKWETFLHRIKSRGRGAEIDNLDSNLDYFKKLHDTYNKKLIAQCLIYDIPYVVINTDDSSLEEVKSKTIEALMEHNARKLLDAILEGA